MHPIDRASRKHSIQEMKKHILMPSPLILEVGCSSGFMLREMRQHLPHAFIMGADYVRKPFESFLGQWVSFPFGIRCELTCRK